MKYNNFKEKLLEEYFSLNNEDLIFAEKCYKECKIRIEGEELTNISLKLIKYFPTEIIEQHYYFNKVEEFLNRLIKYYCSNFLDIANLKFGLKEKTNFKIIHTMDKVVVLEKNKKIFKVKLNNNIKRTLEKKDEELFKFYSNMEIDIKK